MQLEQVKDFILEKLEKGLPEHLTYHTVGHVKDVYDASEKIARLEGVTGDDLILLLTAVLFHDAGFLVESKDHELNSCKLAKKYLPGYGYDTQQIERICAMIMATKIPQSPENLLEEIICDADLDYLGRDDFFTIGDTLYKELRVSGAVSTEKDWDTLQVTFLEQHHYFTRTAINTRKRRKDEYLRMLQHKLKL